MRISIVNVRLVAIVFAGCLLVPKAARADLFVVPWIGGNAGTAGADLVDLGASVGATAGGVVDIDVDLGYSPNYFATSANNAVTTVMGDVTLGIPLGRSTAPRLRPYVTGGIGLIRSRFEIPALASNVVRDEFGTAFGGGLTVFAASRVGVRADLRYLRSLQQTTSDDPFGQINPGRVRYWRASIGVVIR